MDFLSAKIKTRDRCEYWVSANSANSNSTAELECKKILGQTAKLAMPDKESLRQSLTSEFKPISYFVGGFFDDKGSPFWNDGSAIARKLRILFGNIRYF